MLEVQNIRKWLRKFLVIKGRVYLSFGRYKERMSSFFLTPRTGRISPVRVVRVILKREETLAEI